jgi:hypothetical protein
MCGTAQVQRLRSLQLLGQVRRRQHNTRTGKNFEVSEQDWHGQKLHGKSCFVPNYKGAFEA